MTLRVDKEFSDQLRGMLSPKDAQYDLRSRSKLFEFDHPLVLKAKIAHNLNPEQEYNVYPSFGDWNIFSFPNLSCLPENITVVRAQPHHVFEIKTNKPHETLLDFQDNGCVILTMDKKLIPTTQGIHQLVVPLLLNYTFSSDLWGDQGKWSRFHHRLIGIFEKYELLSSPSSPGFYPLKPTANRLKQWGFLGDEMGDTYLLTLPWTFPLTGLEYLEKIIAQEF